MKEVFVASTYKYSPNELSNEERNKKFDWGQTSEFYALYRPPPPASYYKILAALGVGNNDQRILDLGTGVGHLAIQLSKQKCKVVGIDISKNQIEAAKKIASNNNLPVQFETMAAESICFPSHYFDVVTAMQSWPYFQQDLLCPKLQQVLKPSGLIMIGNYDHLPREDVIARETEKLVLRYNPEWQQADWDGYIPPLPKWAEQDFTVKAMFYYDEQIPFTHESWIGRMVASQGIGASLQLRVIDEFICELKKILNSTVKNNFFVLHRLSAHIFELKHNQKF